MTRTSEKSNQRLGEVKAGTETLGVHGRHDRHNNVTAMVTAMMIEMMMMAVMILKQEEDCDDECIRWEKAYVTQLRCLALFQVSTLKSDEWGA